MPDALKCTSCRTPIDVPAGHDGDTIRCGICWTEVPVPKAVVLRPVVAPAAPAVKPKAVAVKESGIRVAALLPTGAKPAAGMARLEALLHKAGSRLRPATAPVKAAPIVPLVSTAPVVLEPEIVTPVPAVPTVAPALPAPLPAAVPVLQPSAAARAKAGRKIEDDEPDRKRGKFKARGDREDDDDDRPRKRATRGGALVFALSAAGVLVVIFVVCGILIFRSFMDDDADPSAENKPGQGVNFNPKVDPNPVQRLQPPGFDPVPPAPVPNEPPPAFPNVPPGFAPVPGVIPPGAQPPMNPAAEAEWKPVERADGFEAKMPGRVIVFDTWQENIHDAANALTRARGKKYQAHDRGYNFDITFVDAPPGSRPDLKKMAVGPGGNLNQVTECKVAGRDGYEYVGQRGRRQEVKRVVQAGRRIFIFSAGLTPMFGRDLKHADDAKAKFFDSVKIPADGGAAADPGGNRPAAGDNPADPPAGVVPNDPPAAGRALTAHARVDPFWAAVTLPDRNEVLLIGTRVDSAGRAAGIIRRFSYPAFVPKNTYYLPLPVTHAVADEKAGKLAVTTVTRTDPLLKESERNIAHGDVQVYDLKPLFDGAVGERDTLTPAATIPFSARLIGLEFADGKGYVLSLTAQPQNKAKPWKTKLSQIDLAAAKVSREMELPDPACRLKAAPDGKKVYATSAAFTPAGVPIYALPYDGFMMVIDTRSWRLESTYGIPGTGCDLAVAAGGTVVASVATGKEFKLFALHPAPRMADLNPSAGKPPTLGYAALTADGTKLVTAASPSAGATGVEVYEVSNLNGSSGLRRVADGRAVKLPGAADAQVPIGGHFHLTPDGRFALFQVGVVLDLTKLPAN